MTGEGDCHSTPKIEGRCLVMGMKLDPSGTELLTCTLAKLTNPGDRVVALLESPSPSQADSFKNKIDAVTEDVDDSFNSIFEVYESFCSLKQIVFEVKVTDGSSFRRALIAEAKSQGAAKLVLGAPLKQVPLRSSFSEAKYCVKRLPSTCSVFVIERGQVVFQKKGTLKDPCDQKLGVLNKMQKTIKSHSLKVQGNQPINGRRGPPLHQLSVGRASVMLEQPVPGGAELNGDEFHDAICPWPVMDPTARKSGILVDTSRIQYDGSTTRYIMKNFQDPLPTDENTNHEKTPLHCTMLNCRSYSQLRHKFLLEDNICDDSEQQSFTHMKTSTCRELPQPQTEEPHCNASPTGWPLLHRSISKSTTTQPCSTRAHRLSAVEWTLQLPERPKYALKEHPELASERKSDFVPLDKSEGLSETLNDPEEHHVQEDDGDLITNNNHKMASLVRKLCQDKSCREFELKQLKTATSDFSVGNLVGKGGFSEVYRGVLPDGLRVAVKCLNSSAPDSEQEFFTEVEVISGLQHRRIVQLIGYCVDIDHYFLIYNLATEGNLEQKLHAAKGNDVLLWDARYKVAVGVAEALEYLHNGCTRPVIHRDVKSSNILLASDLQPQLTDFGLAKWAPTTSTQITCSDVLGTFGYLAPEYFMFGKVSEKTDVYSFGVVLLELITGRRPIDNGNPKGQENLVAWAKPLLRDEASFLELIDPKLEGAYNASELRSMTVAASLCLKQSPASRPRICRISELLKSKGENLIVFTRQNSSCKDMDEGFGVPPECGDHDIRNHLTLALLDLDEDGTSQGSFDNTPSFEHTNKYLEEYLGGRYSRSSSFE